MIRYDRKFEDLADLKALLDVNSKTTWSPNTFKTKLALAHKGLLAEARTEWISYPDIAP